ncbi:hypothetical protein D6850_00595 [Roseovarius spongiae]|uniref:Glycosyltransferase family 10 (Fucosyltransferase) n=1 Tax=Roseovarius spongiae TaxID=2320272 RepID=A0A3A8B590_9RHOB|nr:hypothetical protein [Roseovarius spongiae]RKF17201.1 hypothetical protein D6850_00595 [Roseovarius spongiae]
MVPSIPKVGILPNNMRLGFAPGDIPLADLVWPLGAPPGVEDGRLRDLGPDDHLIVSPRKTVHLRPGFGTRARVSILVMEPAAIHGAHLRALRWTYRRFFRVLTCNEDLLGAIPNGIFFAHGDTWVSEWRDLEVSKTRMCSLIASTKRSQEGHRLRHAVAGWAGAEGRDVDLLGWGYRKFGAKAEGLAPYRYSVVIENVRERNYFTEKIIDAVLCETVPIYWGCPNIGDFLDTDGMILCRDEREIRAAIEAMSPADYAARRPALVAQKARAAHWGDTLRRAAEAVLDAR